MTGAPEAREMMETTLRQPRPFSQWGANAAILSCGENSMMFFAEQKAGFLICYEQFLTWPFLTLMVFNPKILAAPANF